MNSNGSAPSSGHIGRVQTTIILTYLRGATTIMSLDCYPLKYNPDPDALKEVLERGKKWLGLSVGEPKHVEYHAVAALKCGDKVVRHSVNNRVMVDRSTFRRLNANYQFPPPVPSNSNNTPGLQPPRPPHMMHPDEWDPYGNPPMPVQPVSGNNGIQSTRKEEVDLDVTNDELMLTPAVVYGFSLSDQVWLEFNVQKVNPVAWAVDAFANLVLPEGRKILLQSLVEAHHQELGFDDFIKGKGHGLVINLFGPPGVAEATSEHVNRPLYIVGGGDLGTKAADLDAAPERIFDVATAWKAIVLIDESIPASLIHHSHSPLLSLQANVFLEQWSLHDLERNAMVTVFLRHVEYYCGILFPTTNRVQALNEAFLSL